MFPYWILFGGFGFGALVTQSEFVGRRKSMILFSALAAVTLMIGLRHWVGGDWGSYAMMYRELQGESLIGTLQYGIDPGYAVLNWIAISIGAGIWLVNIVCGALLIWGVAAIAVRQPNAWLVFVIAIPYLIIVVGMGYTRQAAAIGLTMVGLAAFLDKRWLKFLVAMIAAALFHKTAIILVPIAALSISTNRIVTLSLLSVLSAMIYRLLVSDQIDQLSTNYLGARLSSEGAGIRIAMNALPAILFLLMQRSFGFSLHERSLWKNMSIGALLAGAAFFIVDSSTVVDRLALYFIVLQLVIFGRFPWLFGRDGAIVLILFGGVIFYSALIQFVWLNFATHAEFWLPYQTIWMQPA